MALIRRCSRLLWIRTRFTRLNDKDRGCCFNETNPDNRGYVFDVQTETRINSHYQSNPPAIKISSDSKIEENFAYNTRNSSDPVYSNNLCYADVKKLIDKYSGNLSPKEKSFDLYLLKACQDMLPDADLIARQDLVCQAWNLLENLGQTFTVEHYNILLSIYAQNSQYLDVEEFFKTMKAEPNRDTFRLLLDTVAEVGDYDQVLKIMTKIEEMGHPINEATFNSLILAYSINANINGAQSVLVTMQASMIELSSATYCALSRGFAVKGDLGELKRVLGTGNLNTKQLMSVVKTLSIFGHGKYISEVMKYLPEGTNIENKDVIYAITELTHLGKSKDALKIVNCLSVPIAATDSSVDFADFFLIELVKSETAMEDILEICENLKSYEKKLSPLLKVTEAALRLKKENTALLAFDAIQNRGLEIRPHFYWPLLVNTATNQRESDIMRLVKHMIDKKVFLDKETLQNYTIPFLSLTDPLLIVRKLQDCGIKISKLLTPLLANLLSKGNLEGAVTLTHEIKGKIDINVVITHLVHAYITMKNDLAIAALLNNINSKSNQNGKFLLDLLAYRKVTVTNEEFASLITAFDRRNLKISKTSAEALEPRITRITESGNLLAILERLIDHNMSENGTETYIPIPHPRDMTIEQLEDHFDDLSNKRMNTRGVLRRLIQIHCSKNNLRKAEKFAKIFTNNRFEWTTGMISGMFSLYTCNNMLDEAEIRYKELKEKHKKFKIDEHKIIDFATALVNNNRWERALEVLGEQENVRCSPETIRNCWRLLIAISASGSSENIKITLDLLLAKGYCEISNHILGPIVRTHLSKGDVSMAVAQFKECVLVYKKTPLQQELIRAIVQICIDKSEAQKQLSEVLAMIKSIHGDAAAVSQLFMALAATNRQKELHRLIKTSAMNHMTLRASVQKLTDEKDLKALQNILKSCRGVRNVDHMIIYDAILTLCSRFSDCDTALQLWEKLQTEEVSPSRQFIEKLINLLESQKVPLPSELMSG